MLYLYLNETIKRDENFERKGADQSSDKFYGLSVGGEKNELHIWNFSIRDSIPEYINKYVTRVSFYESFKNSMAREIGKYGNNNDQFGDSIAEVDNSTIDKNNYNICIRGTKFEDVQKLYHAIRAGTIRPYESWESEQSALSRQDLEEKVVKFRESAKKLTKMLDNERGNVSRWKNVAFDLKDAFKFSFFWIERLKNIRRILNNFPKKSIGV